MFTGIVTHIGRVVEVQPKGGDLRLRVDSGGLPLDDVALGDSLMHNGICLTVVTLGPNWFEVDLSAETLRVTTAGDWREGTRINLEKALRLADRLGGHLVSGHIDGVGEVLERKQMARAEWFRLAAPEPLSRYIAGKGSITVDGTSLTVNAVSGCEFELTIIPHTLEATIIGDYRAGTRVNLEVDLVARYVERLMSGQN